MKKLNKFIACATLLGAGLISAGLASSHETQFATSDKESALKSLDSHYVQSVFSKEGESVDDFVLRLAPILRDYTNKTGFEACAVIAGNGEGLGVDIVTSKATMYCVIHWEKIPKDMYSTSITVHSHPANNTLLPNAVDQRMRKILNNSNYPKRMKNENHSRFSDEDYQTRGYLVTKGSVYHQNGRGTVREVLAKPAVKQNPVVVSVRIL